MTTKTETAKATPVKEAAKAHKPRGAWEWPKGSPTEKAARAAPAA